MTETDFPYDSDVDSDVAADADRKRKLALGGAALAAVVLAGGFLLFGGGDSADEELISSGVTRTPRVAAPAPVKAPITLPQPFKEQLGRDPFRALFVQPAAAPAAPAAPAGAPAPLGAPGIPVPVFGGGTAGTPTGTAGQPAPAGTPTAQTYKLVLKRVYGTEADRTAVFTIDGKQQIAKVGTKFGPTSEIILLSFQQGPKPGQWTTVLQVGDGDPFDVVTGTPVFVR